VLAHDADEVRHGLAPDVEGRLIDVDEENDNIESRKACVALSHAFGNGFLVFGRERGWVVIYAVKRHVVSFENWRITWDTSSLCVALLDINPSSFYTLTWKEPGYHLSEVDAYTLMGGCLALVAYQDTLGVFVGLQLTNPKVEV